jgi:hypothetical protein
VQLIGLRTGASRVRLLFAALITSLMFFAIAPAHAEPQSFAFLGLHFQNDNEGYEPTSDAERHRIAAVEEAFKKQLEASGKYKFVSVPDEMTKKIEAGQPIGECGGCEFDYARDLHVDHIAWLRVQKVSNLILNMNVYMADAASKRVTFIHSVDIRNNTDESWMRALTYLVQNYVLTTPSRS